MKNFRIALWLSAALYFVLSAPAFAGSKRLLIASLGDSITAGTFANHSAMRANDPGFTFPIGGGLKIPFLGQWKNKRTYSWFSGARINSQVALMQRWAKDDDITVLNVAIPGTVASDMEGQALQVAAAMASGKYDSLKYVTLMIGANDVCARQTGVPTSDEEMSRQIGAALDRLAEIPNQEAIRVLVSGMPKIPDLAKPAISQMLTVGKIACQVVRDRWLKECPTLTGWQTMSEYADRIAIVESKNKVIAKAASDAHSRHPNLDVVFTNRFYETEIKPDWLARDCFHPNAIGQEQLSQIMWSEQPWFR